MTRSRSSRLAAVLLISLIAPAAAAAEDAAQAAAVARAVDDLDSAEWIVQYRGIRQLTRLRAKQAKAPLMSLLAGRGHPWVRGRALVALATIFGPEALPQALAHAKSNRAALRAAAVEALGILGSPRGDAVAAQAMTDTDVDVRCQAILAIARLRKAKAWPLVKPLIGDADPRLVRHAARALSAVATPEARRELVRLLEHADEHVRGEAIRGLGRAVRPRDLDALLARMVGDSSPSNRQAARAALAGCDGEMIRGHMLGVLKSDQSALHGAAVELLAIHPDEKTCDALAALARQRGADLLEVLAGFNAERYKAVFVEHLVDESATVRRVAVRAIAACKDVDHFAVLKPALADKDATTLREALAGLQRATRGAPGEGILAYLSDALASRDYSASRLAVMMVAERVTQAELDAGLGGLEAILAGGDDSRRVYAANALARVGAEQTRRRIARAQGYLTNWRLIGPFPNDSDHGGLATAYPPEEEIDFERAYPACRLGPCEAFGVIRDAESRPTGLRITPPAAKVGRTYVLFTQDLPKAARITLAMSVSPPDARLSVVVGPAPKSRTTLIKPDDAGNVTLDLTPRGGGRAGVTFVVETVAGRRAAVVLGRPRILAGGKVVCDLAARASSAVVVVDPPKAPGSAVRWQAHQITDTAGTVAMHDIFPPPTHYNVAYALADFVSDREQKVRLHVAADDAYIAWLNGRRIARGDRAESPPIDAALGKGANRLLLKVANLRDWWHVRVRITDAQGRRVQSVRH